MHSLHTQTMSIITGMETILNILTFLELWFELLYIVKVLITTYDFFYFYQALNGSCSLHHCMCLLAHCTDNAKQTKWS